MTRPLLLALVPTLAAACIDPEVEYGVTSQAALCLLSDCGTNTSVMDGVYFHDLSRLGLPNDAHVRLLGYQNLPAGAVTLDVWTNRLVALDAADVVVGEAHQLAGSELRLGVGTRTYLIRIAAVNRVQHYWAADDFTQLETYRLEYRRLRPDPYSNYKPLCDADDLSPATLALDALVFEGDRYDATTKQIETGAATDEWFNIACLGGAPAKMQLMRHTEASGDPAAGIVTDPRQRKALLNAWTANYCGDGHAFTKPGEPLRIRDASGWLPLTSNRSWDLDDEIASDEAVWDEYGAVCLDTPRREDTEPNIHGAILDHCKAVGHPLPPCATQAWFPKSWTGRGHIRTANPVGS